MTKIAVALFAISMVSAASAASAGETGASSYGGAVSGDFAVLGGLNLWSGFHSEMAGLIGAQGRINVPFSGNFVGQFDASLLADPNVSASSIVNSFSGHIGAHLLFRDPESFQFGAYGGLSFSGVDYAEGWSGNTFGIEGQAFASDQMTLWGQAGVINQTEGGSEPMTLYAVRGGGRFFVDENLRLDVDANFASGDLDGTAASIVGWGAGLEYLTSLGNTPVSLIARYDGTHYDYTAYGAGDELYSHAFRVGVNFKLGTGSLLNQDRHGPNTDLNFASASVLDATY